MDKRESQPPIKQQLGRGCLVPVLMLRVFALFFVLVTYLFSINQSILGMGLIVFLPLATLAVSSRVYGEGWILHRVKKTRWSAIPFLMFSAGFILVVAMWQNSIPENQVEATFSLNISTEIIGATLLLLILPRKASLRQWLILVAITLGILLYVGQQYGFWLDFWLNLGTEFFGVIYTSIIILYFFKIRDEPEQDA